MNRFWPLITVLFFGLGCQSPEPEQSTQDEPRAVAIADGGSMGRLAPPSRVTDREGNTDGVVFIAMYHRITEEEGSFARSRSNFRKDLERMYELGFRPVTLGEYIDDTMDLPPGASPVVMTWDDSDPSQISLLEDGTLDPSTGVGIWTEFAKEHPDFPVKGSFFILKSRTFTGTGQAEIDLLLDLGCEVDSHTLSHKRLDRMSDDGVKKELAGAQEFLKSMGVEQPRFLCLPFGIRPKNRELLKSFEWDGKTYIHDAALMVGAGPARSPNDPKRDPHRLPRIQAYDGELGLTHWLDQVEAGNVKPYVQP